MKKRVLLVSALLSGVATFAQEQMPEVEMADQMRQNGKIYVVVAILCVIMAGVIVYLWKIDRSVSRLEKEKK